MKLLVLGGSGQLGGEIVSCLQKGATQLGKLDQAFVGCEWLTPSSREVNIAVLKDVTDYLSTERFDIVINCAAMTNVDGCETDIKGAFLVNAVGARNLAIASDKTGAKLVHISTDYVFSGDSTTPYTECDIPTPCSVYGKTKLLGEEYVKTFCKRRFIIRTAWLYSHKGKNFVKTIARLATTNGEVKVVNDQVGSPTNVADLAHHIFKLIGTEEYGTYHGSGNGECSWYDFACKIVEYAGISAAVTPCTTAEFPTPTKRPAYSVLDNLMFRSTVGDEFRHWDEALKAFFLNKPT